MSFSEGHGYGSDLVLLWQWCRLVAAAPFRPLAWEPPYATGVAIKSKKKNPKKHKISCGGCYDNYVNILKAMVHFKWVNYMFF